MDRIRGVTPLMDGPSYGYLRIPPTHTPVLPETFVGHELPFCVAVPEPELLRFFPAYFDGIYSHRPLYIRTRYDRALEVEAVWLVTVALAADLYWTGRSVFLEDPLIALLRRTVDLPPP